MTTNMTMPPVMPVPAPVIEENEASSTGKRLTKVLIAIPTCKEDKHLEDACRATWAKPGLSRGGYSVDVQFFDGPTLGVGDSYEELPIKVQAMCKWALAHGCDFLLKVDSDTFVWVDRILGSRFEAHDYSGYANPKFPADKNYASGGAGYWLSKRAMKIVAEAELTDDTAEDRWLGRVLFDAGVRLYINTLHAHGRHDEAAEGRVLTMHPCSSREWMERMRDAG